jgi:hypothetical protein
LAVFVFPIDRAIIFCRNEGNLLFFSSLSPSANERFRRFFEKKEKRNLAERNLIFDGDGDDRLMEGVRIPPPAPVHYSSGEKLITQNLRFYSCQIASTHSVKQHKLRKRIAYLSDKESKTKDFISLYLPPQTTLDQVIATIKKEAECATLDSEREKQLLQDVLKIVVQQLKQFKEIQENGLAMFAGNYGREKKKNH